jgi:hypothetical protein
VLAQPIKIGRYSFRDAEFIPRKKDVVAKLSKGLTDEEEWSGGVPGVRRPIQVSLRMVKTEGEELASIVRTAPAFPLILTWVEP